MVEVEVVVIVDVVAAVVLFDVVVVVEELSVTKRGNQPPSHDLLRVGSCGLE